MFKKLGILTALVLGVVLLVYSATRSLDFIRLTLPADRQIVAWFALAALDGGLVAWLLSYLYAARGWQRVIAFVMVIVDLAGAVAMFTLDTLYNTGRAGMTTALTADELETAVLALSGVIALNIAATVAHHMTDPDNLRAQAEEEAFDKVESATLKQISKNADQLAAQLAPTMAADWMRNTQARYMAQLGTGKIPTLLDGKAEDVTPASSADKPKPTQQPVNALWRGLFGGNGNGRKFKSATVAPAVAVAARPDQPPAVAAGPGQPPASVAVAAGPGQPPAAAARPDQPPAAAARPDQPSEPDPDLTTFVHRWDPAPWGADRVEDVIQRGRCAATTPEQIATAPCWNPYRRQQMREAASRENCAAGCPFFDLAARLR